MAAVVEAAAFFGGDALPLKGDRFFGGTIGSPPRGPRVHPTTVGVVSTPVTVAVAGIVG